MISRRKIVLGGASVISWLGRSMAEAASSGKFEIVKSDEEWRRELTREQYAVLRRHDTERAWTSPLNKEYRSGTYVCAGCDLPLFSSSTKFDSKTGWPSFWAPIGGQSKQQRTAASFSWSAPRFIAAEATSDMFLMMGPSQRASVTA